MALMEAKRRGCKYIGVTHRMGKKFLYYIARSADWYGEHSAPSSFRGNFNGRFALKPSFSIQPTLQNILQNQSKFAKNPIDY